MFGLHMGRMGGTGRVGSAPIWTPAANFPLGTEPGLWYDPSTFTGLYQDSAGTSPATAVGQPVGKMLDKSGRNNHISQATVPNRPIIGASGAIQYTTFDGLDDGMSTGAITLGSDMDCFIAIRTTDTAGVLLSSNQVAGYYVGHVQSGSTATATGGIPTYAGSPTYAVNGVAVVGGTAVTAGQLYTDLCTGAWKVLEVRNFNPSAWAVFGLMGLYPGFAVSGDIAGVILCPAGDATARQENRQWLGNKVGLVLP